MKQASNIFKALAIIGQLAALFPFAVMSVAVSEKPPELWRFAVIFAVWLLFRAAGWGAGSLAERIKRARKSEMLHPLINFAARLCCVIPLGAFVAACVVFELPSALYFYTIPPSVAIYFGGYSSVGRSYSDVFTKGCFAVYPISALLLSVMLAVGEVSAPWAGGVLCIGLALEILLFVVIANQANIDKCTKQRDAGKAALPRGLRRYNAAIVISAFTASLGLFIFAKPLGRLIVTAVVAVIGAVMFVIDLLGNLFSSSNVPSEELSGNSDRVSSLPARFGADPNDIFITLAVIVAAVLLIAFRKQLWSAFKRAFAAAFKNRDKRFDTPYVDEIMSSDAKPLTPREVRKAERELFKKYARETSPALRYRLGYALFLARLRHTENPPAPSDTTDIHREKGERSFGIDLSELSETYSRVRYGGAIPTAEQLAAEDELIRGLRSKK